MPALPLPTKRFFIMEHPNALPRHATLSIVGIGASAGGLDALKSFFSAVPATSNMAFVVVTHRDPADTSLLPEILHKCTTLPITEAENGVVVQANHIYTSPSSHYLRLD